MYSFLIAVGMPYWLYDRNSNFVREVVVHKITPGFQIGNYNILAELELFTASGYDRLIIHDDQSGNIKGDIIHQDSYGNVQVTNITLDKPTYFFEPRVQGQTFDWARTPFGLTHHPGIITGRYHSANSNYSQIPREAEEPLRKRNCINHEWADTGFALTWCKHCNISARISMGIVHIEENKIYKKNELDY